jgi:hypothetical protein
VVIYNPEVIKMPKDQKALTYSSYANMVQRCSNPKASHYANYGGRGISVCPRWLGPKGFFFFCVDMGLRPQGTSIDRIDPSGDYSPENCRWATPQEQSRNRENTPQVTLFGKQMSVIEASEQLDINISTVRSRIHRGYSLEDALTFPLSKQRIPSGERKNSIRSNTIRVKVNGVIMSLKQAAKACFIPYSTVHSRIASGMNIRNALLEGVRCDNPDERKKKLSGITVEPYELQ